LAWPVVKDLENMKYETNLYIQFVFSL